MHQSSSTLTTVARAESGIRPESGPRRLARMLLFAFAMILTISAAAALPILLTG